MRTLIKEWIIPFIIALVIASTIKRFLFFVAFIPSGSMENTIMTGERLLVTRVHKPEKLERGSIVVFYSKEENVDLIKRLIGLPGDRIKIVDGIVYVNGEEMAEPYVENKDKGTYFEGNEIVVPDNSYFFLGDNRAGSIDGRFWSQPFIAAEDIKGQARLVIFPFNKIRFLDD